MIVRAGLAALLVQLVVTGMVRGQTSDPAPPTLSGFVTAVGTGGSFEVNGRHIAVSGQTKLAQHGGGRDTSLPSLGSLYLGEKLDVYGHLDKKTSTLTATQVTIREEPLGVVSGTALIDLLPPPVTDRQGETLVRADGYLLRVTGSTQTHWIPPLASLKDLATNVWVDYHGVQQADGTVLVDTLSARPNTVSHSEGKLREKREFDPAQVDEGDKQGFWSTAFKGIDPKRFPAHHDAEMQARVERIGNSLVPAYQKALPASDPTKIEFRFQVIEHLRLRDALSLPNGIVLIPLPVMERLENDTQLATVLADNIAGVLEKQEVRAAPANQAIGIGGIAGDIGGIFVPGLSLATGLGGFAAEKHMLTVAERQSGRVSLWLLHDVGYDIAQAPRTWWLLGTKKTKHLDETSPPARAANLYVDLGTTWRKGF